MVSMDFNRGSELYYPLAIELLPTDDYTNNVDVWDAVTYLEGSLWDDDHDDVGIPADSGVGMSVSGQVIYPIWNNVAVYTPQQCEVKLDNLTFSSRFCSGNMASAENSSNNTTGIISQKPVEGIQTRANIPPAYYQE